MTSAPASATAPPGDKGNAMKKGSGSVQPYSSTGGDGHSTPHGPSKLVRNASCTNVFTKSSAHSRGNSSCAVPPLPLQRSTPHTQPAKDNDGPASQSHQPTAPFSPACPHQHTTSSSTARYMRIASEPTSPLKGSRRLQNPHSTLIKRSASRC